MDPTVTVVAPPPATTDYLHSITSKTDSWGEHNSLHLSNHDSSASASIKLRLMCSYGGHILPRPHDKSLCYVGGETRMVVVDRQTTLLDLTHRLTKTLLRSFSSSTVSSTEPSSFTLKYQLPSEDLDSLISVTTDEDLENMIEEYERLNSSSTGSKSSRLRLFVFPTKPESVSSIGSFLENSSKSEDWFLNALNGTSSGFSDTSSVNCLLGLEDEISLPEKKDVNHKSIIGANLKGNNSGQDVHSIPDSPMMETTSSFGSASSTPSLPNLPPIKVNMDDQPKVVGGIEEQFSQITVQQRHHKHQDDRSFVPPPAPVVVSGSPLSSATAIPDHSDPFLSYHERSDQGLQMAYLKHHHHQQQQHYQQKQSSGFDLASGDSVLSDGNKNRAAIPNDTTQMMQQQQNQNLPNSAYLLSMPSTQIDKQHPQLHHQQLEFIQTAVPPPQYIHHHHPSGVVPATSYYQMYPPMDQQNFLYYMPATQPLQGYNFPLQQKQPGHPEPSLATKTELAAGVYRATNSGAPQLIRVQSSPQHIRYSEIHNPSQSVASSASGGGGGNYGYEFADSLQQVQQRYYATQPMPPLSAAQSQTMTSTSPVNPGSQQQVTTAQP